MSLTGRIGPPCVAVGFMMSPPDFMALKDAQFLSEDVFWMATTAKPPATFEVADLFCGAGGMSLGFTLAGFHIVTAIDNWAPAIKT